MLNVIALIIQVSTSLLLIVLVLLHAGKGGGLSDMFGGGSVGLSGGTSMERRLDRITVVAAIVWGLATFWLSWMWNPGG